LAAYLKTISPSLGEKLACNAHFLAAGLKAGEAIAACDPCYIKTDGTIWRSNGTAATAAAAVHGWALRDAVAGSPLTLGWNIHLPYGPGTATPSTKLYVSATPGQLDTAPTVGGTAPVAVVDYISNDGSVPHAVIFAMRSTY
jgi:hypothetical protein